MRRWRWEVPILVLLAAAVLAGGGYLAFNSLTELRPDYGGRLVEGVAGGPSTLNPLLAQFNDADKDISSLVFSGLTRLSPNGELVPDLAQRWDIEDGGRRYRFVLRDGVRWHDGIPFTADDVVFSFKMIQAKDFPGSTDLAALWKDVGIAKKDDLTVEFTLPQPYAPFLSTTTLGIVPVHLLRDVRPADLTRAPFNANPIGAGPYRLIEAYVDRMILKANPDYPLGRPFIDEIELRFFRDDPALLTALEEKRIDSALLRPDAPRDRLEKLETSGRFTALRPLRTNYSAVFLNAALPVFQDKSVRQALLMATDRERIVRELLGGRAEVAHSPIVPETWAASGDVKRYPYDADKAASLLDTAGWKPGADGVRQKDGKDLRFTLVTNEDRTRMAIMQMLADAWNKLGAKVQVSALGPAGLIQNYLAPRHYEAVLYGLDTGYDPDAYPLWHSTQRGEDQLNIAGYSNPKVDETLEKARQTTDEDARKKLYGEFQSVFAEEVPAILLYYPRYAYLVDSRVQGVNVGALFETSSRFYDARNWYIQTKRVLKRR